MSHDQIDKLMLSAWFGPLLIPIVFAVVGVFAKSLSKKRLDRDSFFLGLESSLAALSIALASLYSAGQILAKGDTMPPDVSVLAIAFFVVMNFFGLIIVMFLHQTCEPIPKRLQHDGYTEPSLKTRIWVQGVTCNIIGLALLVMSSLVLR